MEELAYQNVHPDNIQAAAKRVRQFFKGPTRNEAEKLKLKCMAVQSGELTGQRAVFSAHEQILLPYLLPWACKKLERLDFFMENMSGEDGHYKCRGEEFWGDSWQKAVKAFFEHFQDTASFRMLGRTLYMAKDKEAMADNQPVRRPYLELLTDNRGTSLCQSIIWYGLGKAVQDCGLQGPGMLGSQCFCSGYVTAAMRSYLGSQVGNYQQKRLLERCIEFLQNRSKEKRGWLRTLYDTWCMSKIDLDKLEDSLRELRYVEYFKDEVLQNVEMKAYIKEEMQPYPKTSEAIERLRAAKAKADEEAKASRERKILAKLEQRQQEYPAITVNEIKAEGRQSQEKQDEKKYLAPRTEETSSNVLPVRSPIMAAVEPPERGTESVKTEEPADKSGLLGKAWQKIKGWFFR